MANMSMAHSSWLAAPDSPPQLLAGPLGAFFLFPISGFFFYFYFSDLVVPLGGSPGGLLLVIPRSAVCWRAVAPGTSACSHSVWWARSQACGHQATRLQRHDQRRRRELTLPTCLRAITRAERTWELLAVGPVKLGPLRSGPWWSTPSAELGLTRTCVTLIHSATLLLLSTPPREWLGLTVAISRCACWAAEWIGLVSLLLRCGFLPLGAGDSRPVCARWPPGL